MKCEMNCINELHSLIKKRQKANMCGSKFLNDFLERANFNPYLPNLILFSFSECEQSLSEA